jgi:hypothetical protein
MSQRGFRWIPERQSSHTNPGIHLRALRKTTHEKELLQNAVRKWKKD